LCAATFLAIAIPSAPSGVGVYHAAASMLLVTLGAGQAAATAFAVATHLIVIGVVVTVLSGLPSLLALRATPPVREQPAPSDAALPV
jgi:uncharacterized membrane protein YbhN (UPF0104 family)